MENYVTLFDSLFLPQGLALYNSMQRHLKKFTLWILCVDDEAFKILNAINLPNVILLQASKLETPELLEVKSTRTKAEYCWTLTPFAPKFVFESDPIIKRVTYIDADLWFLKDPSPIFEEFDVSRKHVLITEHGYSPEYDQSDTSGKYCVQFIVFSRDGGEHIRKWWEDRCIEWCYARFEKGKFGDQKYLDDWPERFKNSVHVLNDNKFALAPWNATRFPYSEAIFFHFHGLRILNEKEIKIGNYSLPSPLIKYVYRPYFEDLKIATLTLSRFGFKHKSQAKNFNALLISRNILISIYSMLRNSIKTGKINW
jgi:hypothetical protein